MSANGSTVSKNNTKGFLRAVRNNDIATVRQYIDAGLNVNQFVGEDKPLYIAIQSNNVDMVRVLLEADAMINTLVEIESLLYTAVGKGNLQIVDALLRSGANPNFENLDKKTPLFKAVETNAVKIIQLLCEYNADPNYHSIRDDTPMTLAKTARVKEALEACVPKRGSYNPTAKQIQGTITNLISTKGTFPIQSQKTGQCFSDSIQHVLYFADGVRDYFIQRAIEAYPRIRAAGELPLTKEAYLAYMTEKITKQYAKRKAYAKNSGYDLSITLEEYITSNLPRETATLYLDYTGVRFLDMFLRPIMSTPASKKGVLARRPSVASFFSEQPTGIVCSQVIGIYQVAQSIYKDRAHLIGARNGPRVSTLTNLPATLNEEGAGLLTDIFEYDFWKELLYRIPGELGVATIKGVTNTKEFQAYNVHRANFRFVIDPKYIVGVTFSVFPRGHVRRDFGAGHALSLVKTHGQWYMCDNNIGVSLPCNPFDFNELVRLKFIMRYKGYKIEYLIFDEDKQEQLYFQEKERTGRTNIVIPEELYSTILASVPLKSNVTPPQYFEEEFEGGEGGFMDMTFSRKYIFWQPRAVAAPVVAPLAAPAVAAAANEDLRALAARYGITIENVGAAGSGSRAAGSGGP